MWFADGGGEGGRERLYVLMLVQFLYQLSHQGSSAGQVEYNFKSGKKQRVKTAESMRQRERVTSTVSVPLSPLAAAKLSKLGQQCQEWSSTLEKVQQARAQERGQTERVITAKVDAESIYMYGLLSCTHTFQLPCFLFMYVYVYTLRLVLLAGTKYSVFEDSYI